MSETVDIILDGILCEQSSDACEEANHGLQQNQ